VLIPIILSGGSGTRLWPLSRELYPKQLLALCGKQTMLQETVLRLNALEGVTDPIVICNEEHRFMVAEQLRQIGVEPRAIVLEPMGRNTAPAAGIGALLALDLDKDAVLLVLPADHLIQDTGAFAGAVQSGVAAALGGSLVTFGIVPKRPETGYGYIKKGERQKTGEGRAASGGREEREQQAANSKRQAVDSKQQAASSGQQTVGSGQREEVFGVERFVEKPDLETAQAYVDSGEYLWNSGMFLFRADSYLAELGRTAPEMVKRTREALERSTKDLDFIRLDRDAFHACPGESIDYAVMEKTSLAALVPMDAGWSDVGSWSALLENGSCDTAGNVCQGDVLLHDVRNCFVHSSGRLVAAVGLEGHVVVETKDAVLVAPQERVQDVKELVKKLKQDGRGEAVVHSKVYRPWGAYESIDFSERFQVKRITVKPGEVLSLQMHHHRAEHWVVVRGTARITRGEDVVVLTEDQSTYIPLGTVHRLENPGKIPLELIEVQTGSYLGEDDIVRLDDMYGRGAE
jgi:mannose-1-phosphate guanylyltransferase / mannose-6-phosphate isomerase